MGRSLASIAVDKYEQHDRRDNVYGKISKQCRIVWQLSEQSLTSDRLGAAAQFESAFQGYTVWERSSECTDATIH